jgi:uncharacterized protein YggT (Ycf19 family)
VTKEKFPELVSEFLSRFSHPEYFQNPQSYLRVAITPLSRPVRILAKSIPEITQAKPVFIPYQATEKALASVPS